MNAITNPPNQNYDFGHDFSYAQWTPNTVLTLTNVPWTNTYRDVVGFSSRAALNTFIDEGATKIVLDRATIAKPNQPIFIDIPINQASQFNYIRATNPSNPVGDLPKDYYYFILGVEYHAPNTTMLITELDVWATYFTDITFDQCYVERGHIGIANDQQWNDYGKKYLTIPEGLDLGAEYKPIRENSSTIYGEGTYDFLVTSTISLVEPPGTEAAPNLPAARGTGMSPFYLPTESYVIKGIDMIGYFTQMSQYPWITQGIIEVRVIPSLDTLGIPYTPIPRANNYPPGTSNLPDSYLNSATQLAYLTKTFTNPDFRTHFENALPERYQHLKKFLTSPYSSLVLTTHDANHVHYKPELFPESNANYSIVSSFMPGNAVMKAKPAFYNDRLGSQVVLGETKDYECTYASFPMFPVLNNGALLAIAGSARSTAHSYESADWAHARTLEGARVSYDNQTAQMEATIAQGELSRSVDAQGVDISNRYAIAGAASNVGMGIVGGAMAGGPAGAAVGAVAGTASAALQTGMQIARSNEELALRQSASLGAQNISVGTSATIAGNNNNLAQFAARGDYENTIGALNARVQDLQMTPPSLAGQLVGDFIKVLEGSRFQLVWKTLHDGVIARIGEYWLRYGYAIHSFVKPPANLHCMTKFTYWKMTETYLTANIPEFYKNTIRGIFEKGVTVWQNPDEIGKVDPAENEPLTGIRY